jgi:hypothetical protein
VAPLSYVERKMLHNDERGVDFFRVAVVGAFFSYVLVKRLLTRNQIGYRA